MTDFDAKAKGWDEVPGRRERANAVAAAIREQVRLSVKMSALEYGCGTGLLSFALQPYLGKIILADSSAGMLEVVKEKIAASGVKNMSPLLLDLSRDPLSAQRFHFIYSLMTLHHIPNTADILQKFQALLEPGGILCIADLDKEDGTFHDQDHGEHHGFDREELRDMLIRAGFEKIHFSTPYKMQKGSNIYPLFLASGEKR